MILTNCAACAAPLVNSATGIYYPRWVCTGRCQTYYCSQECSNDHWFRGGHDQICDEIQRGGGAEQYHANQKYNEAVAVAVEACTDDTRGQTCYICYGEGDEDEGLVRMCSCRGTAGFAHVSCLARQAQVAVERGRGERGFDRWYSCGLCEQDYHGVGRCALGWACWKTYVGRPEADWYRRAAMAQLGNGLSNANHHEDALTVEEAMLSMERRLGKKEYILVAQNNLARTYQLLGRDEEALAMYRDVHSGHLKLLGEEHRSTLVAANNYASALNALQRFEEAKTLLPRIIPTAQRVLGGSDTVTLRMRWIYAMALYEDPAATLDDLRESVETLEHTGRITRRVLGGAHPVAQSIERHLRNARAALRTRETREV